MKARQATKLKMLLVIVILPSFFRLPSDIAYYKSSFLTLPVKDDDKNNGSVNLRKRYSYKPYIIYIGTSKAKNQTNRYCLWIISLLSWSIL
jgi:hypothetical protein